MKKNPQTKIPKQNQFFHRSAAKYDSKIQVSKIHGRNRHLMCSKASQKSNVKVNSIFKQQVNIQIWLLGFKEMCATKYLFSQPDTFRLIKVITSSSKFHLAYVWKSSGQQQYYQMTGKIKLLRARKKKTHYKDQDYVLQIQKKR